MTALFSITLHRRLLATNVPGYKAERIKRRNPAIVLKFSGFGGAA